MRKPNRMDCDVLVVGAGPVGLMLGCELARRGVSHKVIETKPKRERYCKALGVSPRTLEVLDTMGLLDEALRLGFHFTAMNTVVMGQVVSRIDASKVGELPYNNFALAQPDMEDLLEGFWGRLGHSIERDTSLLSFEQDDEGVTAHLSDGRTMRARYLVGCDGAHSAVRKTLGTAFDGERFGRSFVLGDLHLRWNHPHTEGFQFILLEDGEMRNNITVIPNPTAPGRYRVSTSIEADAQCDEHPTLEFLQELIQPALPEGTVVSDLRWSSHYNISHRIAERYRTGRVFLAGDAAHIHPPIGGLGMNTGLQDAHNLGWKLAEVLQGRLHEAILDTYHSERHQVGRAVVQVTAGRMERAMRGEDPRGNPEPPQFDTQLRIRYEAGLLVGGDTASGLPRPGDRLPSVTGLHRTGVYGQARLPEILRDGRFHLFTYRMEHAAVREAVESAFGEGVRCWAIVDASPDEAMGHLLDGEGRWAQEVGGGAVLVRPDGVIGWRGQDLGALKSWLDGFTGNIA